MHVRFFSDAGTHTHTRAQKQLKSSRTIARKNAFPEDEPFVFVLAVRRRRGAVQKKAARMASGGLLESFWGPSGSPKSTKFEPLAGPGGRQERFLAAGAPNQKLSLAKAPSPPIL